MANALKSGDTYCGWRICESSRRPITGRWTAIRHGVELCASNAEALKRMIDQRYHDERERRRLLELEAK